MLTFPKANMENFCIIFNMSSQTLKIFKDLMKLQREVFTLSKDNIANPLSLLGIVEAHIRVSSTPLSMNCIVAEFKSLGWCLLSENNKAVK